MKMHHAFSLPALVVAGALCWAAPPHAWAQAAPQTVTDPSTGLAVQTVSSATVKISGTVSGGTESVALSGTVTIESRAVWSELNTAAPAAITLTIDLSGISGTGKSTRAKYVTNAREIALRQLSATDLVDVAFPFYVSGTGGFPSARTGLARFSFAYDVNTGVLTSASGSLTSP
jgi:hypothetical protein